MAFSGSAAPPLASQAKAVRQATGNGWRMPWRQASINWSRYSLARSLGNGGISRVPVWLTSTLLTGWPGALQGEVLQPVAYQAVPLEAAPLMELAAEQLQARQAPGSVATQAAEPVLQLQPGRMAMAQLLLLLDRLRPALDFLAVAPEQVGQRLQQMARGELAERRQRQATLSPQSLDLGLQLHRQALGIPVPLDPALHAFGQLELQLPVVQRVQFERLFVVAGQLLVVETHLEPLLEERTHRVGEELRQRSQPQCALQFKRRQGRFGVGNGDVVLAMDLAPLAGIGEQAIDALLRRIVKIPTAERLQRMLLGQGTQQRRRRRPGPDASRPPGDRATGRSAPRAAARHCRGYPPHPAHVELLARREQRLEQQVAVVPRRERSPGR